MKTMKKLLAAVLATVMLLGVTRLRKQERYTCRRRRQHRYHEYHCPENGPCVQ